MTFGWSYRFVCPSETVLSRAFSEGMKAALSDHVATCKRCKQVTHGLQQLRDLGQHLGTYVPSETQLEQTRTSLLASHQMREPGLRLAAPQWPWRRLSVGAVGVATAAAAILAWRLPSRQGETPAADGAATTFHARVLPQPGARFDSMGTLADEVVRLREGDVHFDVSPLVPSQRFRVVAGDGEVEVRGTAFDVSVRGDHLAAVHVDHGRVEVRVNGRPGVTLGAHEDWNAGVQTLAPENVDPSASETAFIAGWSAFRATHFAEAVTSFDQVLRLAPDSSLAEDAEYWRAISLARLGSPVARDELRAFLRKYPRSGHADDASVTLGWKLLQTGDRAQAEERFRLGLKAASDDVRRSAHRGLQRVQSSISSVR